MGEEEKKAEENKPEEAQKAEQEGKQEKKEDPKAEKPSEAKKADESNDSKDPPPPPPPQEIVLKVYMHCEGCAKKVRRCLKGFQGVEDVQTDCKTHKVVVKGEKADSVKVMERVQRKSHRQVELLSPIPKPPAEDAKKVEDQKEVAKPEEKQEEVITVVLKVHMHCEACAQEIKRRILRMNGVENVEADLKSSQVTVKGVFDPPKLVEYVYKRTGKQASIVKQEPEKKEKENEKGNEEKKAEDGGDEGTKKKGEEGAKEEKGGEGEADTTAAAAADGEEETANVLELRKSEFYYNYPQNHQFYAYPARFESNPYPPQIFSDENPNACSVM